MVEFRHRDHIGATLSTQVVPAMNRRLGGRPYPRSRVVATYHRRVDTMIAVDKEATSTRATAQQRRSLFLRRWGWWRCDAIGRAWNDGRLDGSAAETWRRECPPNPAFA